MPLLTSEELLAVTDRLRQHEGWRSKVYDDATGLPIVPGSLVVGHPTIGYGRALDTNGINVDEGEILLQNDVFPRYDALVAALPWVVELSSVRQGVLLEMAYQMGLSGLLTFKRTLAAVRWHHYTYASRSMLDSLWAKQTPARAARLAAIMRTGTDA